MLARLQASSRAKVEVFTPEPQAVIQFVAREGEQAMYKSISLRKACCHIRKMEPLERALAGPLVEGRITLIDGRTVAPAAVMDLPGLNSGLLPSDMATRKDVPIGLLDEDTLRLLLKDGVLKDTAASKSALLDRLSDGSLPCWIGERPGDIAPYLQSLAKDGADLTLPGWPLLAWLLSAPGDRKSVV